ncbi:hypothetical protein [Bernardetia sp. MNP-M8]|uniref:hypothetical protein n=1 Tax=Bernardetia sp. MNP-M8 TaxID=3127470 RepID=UPI0030D4CF8F
MEQLTINFFTYSIYCLTIAVPIIILEKVGLYSNVKFIFSLGIKSFGKTIENSSLIKLEKFKGQSISTEKTEFQFDENGVIYIKSFRREHKKRTFGESATIKALAKTANKNTLKVQSYTFLQDTLYLIFLPIICISAIIAASYNPDGNAELGFIPLVMGIVFFILSKFEHKRKFNQMCKELEEILAEKVVTNTKKTTQK